MKTSCILATAYPTKLSDTVIYIVSAEKGVGRMRRCKLDGYQNVLLSASRTGEDNACQSRSRYFPNGKSEPDAPSTHNKARASGMLAEGMVGSGGQVGHQRFRLPMDVLAANIPV